MARRRGYAALAVLNALDRGYAYGFDIIDATRLPGGTVYPTLTKLEDEGLVRSLWEDARQAQRDKRPPRRYYELRPDGRRALHEWLRQFRELDTLPRAVKPRTRHA